MNSGVITTRQIMTNICSDCSMDIPFVIRIIAINIDKQLVKLSNIC